MKDKEPNFEDLLKELEQTVADLEQNVNLDQALRLFERGMELSTSCEKYLAEAKQRVERLRNTPEGLKLEGIERQS